MKKIMLSKKERRYLELPRLFNENYTYVVKHRIKGKIKELQKDLDLIIDSKENFYKDWLKGIFENFIARLPEDL